MPVWNNIGSDRIVMTAAGPQVAAMVRTIGARAVIDPDAATTTIAEPLARRLPHMPDQAARAAAAGQLPLRGAIDVKLRRRYHPIAHARFVAAMADGATLDVGRDVLEQEALVLDFAAGRIADAGGRAAAAPVNGITLSLTLDRDGYAFDWAGTTIAFRPTTAIPPAVPVRTIAVQGVLLPVHDDPRIGAWIGWDAFAGKRIVLDLPRRRIVMYPPGE